MLCLFMNETGKLINEKLGPAPFELCTAKYSVPLQGFPRELPELSGNTVQI
jgi:hypothetical protein